MDHAAINRGSDHISLCDNCGNQTRKFHVAHYGADPNFYTLFRCDICAVAVLYHKIPGRDQYEQVWPISLILPTPPVPERVSDLYLEAQAVRSRSASAFAGQIGRALEAMATDQNAQGNTLNDRINWLIQQGILPEPLGQMAHINRYLRNWGVHDSEMEVLEADIDILDEFFRAVIDYVYIAPGKIATVQQMIDSRRNPSDTNTSPGDQQISD